MAKIIIYVPDEAPVKYGLGEEAEVTVGRTSDNDIVIDHDSISGTHAKFGIVDGAYHLYDMGSTNGTFAEGEEANDVQLHNGMRITFGKVDADFECEDVEAGGGEVAAEEEGAAASDDSGFGESSGGGESFGSGVQADLAENSVRPAGFSNLSPIEKVEEKDKVASIAMLLGVLAIVAAIALVVLSAVMTG